MILNRNLPVYKLAIVDDHQIVIDGLKLLLRGKKNFVIVAEANSAEGIFKLLEEKPVDLLITDIMMPGISGYELSLKIKKEMPGIKILALSMSEDGAMIVNMIDEARVDGYIPKAAGKEELITAIEMIASGHSYYSNIIMDQYGMFKKIKSENEVFHLTTRELEIIEYMIQHMSNREIAQKLFISERTVETHRKNIFRKTNTKGMATLAQLVAKHQLLK